MPARSTGAASLREASGRLERQTAGSAVSAVERRIKEGGHQAFEWIPNLNRRFVQHTNRLLVLARSMHVDLGCCEIRGSIDLECARPRSAEIVTRTAGVAVRVHLYVPPRSSVGGRGINLYRARSVDVRDVRRRVLERLGGVRSRSLGDLSVPSLIVATDLPPSEMALAPRDKILGFATDLGGRTSHTAIMARARGIPAVVGLKGAMDAAREGVTALVDGNRGIAVFEPDPETLEEHRRKKRRYEELNANLAELRDARCVTQDGRSIVLGANLEVPEELPGIQENGADGIGLYRTEFFYLSRRSLPTEEVQFETYRSIVEAMAPRPVTIRTLDVGGDKFASYLGAPVERNPFLGMRGLRFSLRHEEIFRTQVRAILRATAFGNVRIMFPMVVGLEDFRKARAIVDRARRQLTHEGIAMAEKVPLGVMVETPASVFAIDLLARESDFVSIGTNDLIQYTLAVDRGNETMAEVYEPLHPAVLRAIRTVVEAGRRFGIRVGICGEMAGEPLYALLLVGLGVADLSVSPYLLPEIKTIVRASTYEEAVDLAQRCLSLSTPSEARTVVTDYMSRRFPQYFSA